MKINFIHILIMLFISLILSSGMYEAGRQSSDRENIKNMDKALQLGYEWGKESCLYKKETRNSSLELEPCGIITPYGYLSDYSSDCILIQEDTMIIYNVSIDFVGHPNWVWIEPDVSKNFTVENKNTGEQK